MINTDWCWFSVQLENILNCNFVLKIFVRRLSWDLGAVVCGQMEAAILETLERRISDWEPLEHPQWEIWEIGNVQTISIMDWDGLGKLAPMIRSHNRVAHLGICNVTLHLIIDRCAQLLQWIHNCMSIKSFNGPVVQIDLSLTLRNPQTCLAMIILWPVLPDHSDRSGLTWWGIMRHKARHVPIIPELRGRALVSEQTD